jgi:hypothetical protein
MISRTDLFFKANESIGCRSHALTKAGEKVKLRGCKTYRDYFVCDYWLKPSRTGHKYYYYEIDKIVDVEI